MRAALLAMMVLAGVAAWQLSGSRDAASAADATSVPANGTLGSSAGDVELPRLRTAHSRTWVRADGLHVTRVYQQVVNFKDAQGDWQPIDDTLEPSGSAWVNRSNDFKVTLPDRLGTGPVRVEHRGSWIAMQLRGDDVAAQVDGSSATFAGVGAGLTARWSAEPRRLKEDLVLADAGAPTSYSYDVSLSDGLSLRDAQDGSVEAVDADGNVVFVLAAPFAVDAAGVRAPADAVTMHAGQATDGWTVHVALSDSWAHAADRAFPVTVDPSVYPLPAPDCTIDSGSPTTTDCASATVTAGHVSGTTLHEQRALFDFDLTRSVPAGANVMSATLWAYATAQSGGGAPLSAYRVTQDWSSSVTWNQRDVATNWTTAGGDVASTAESTAATPVVNDWTGWDLTDLVRGWLEGTYAQQGVLVKDGGSSMANATTFDSSDASDSSKWPALEVDYFPPTGRMDDYTFDSQSLSDRQTLSVNPAGGNMLLSSRDLEIRGTGMDLALERAFNSGDDWTGALGFGNRLSLGTDVALLQCDDTESMCFYGPTGTHMRFKLLSDGSFQAPPGANARLVRNSDGSYAMTFDRTGIVYRFFASQNTFLTDVVDPNGNRIHMDYSSSRLADIVDTQGRRITVTRNSSGDITAIADPTGRTWRYGYSTTGRKLTSVTDPEGNVTQYHFNSSDDIDQITDARGNQTQIAYDSLGRVTSVTRTVDGGANDVVTSFAYSTPSSPCGSGDIGETVVTDPRGKRTTYCWNADGQVTKTFDALSRETTQSFTSNLDQSQAVDYVGTGNSATTSYNYDTNNDLTRATEPSGEQQTQTYWSASSNTSDPLRAYRVESTTDANGASQYFDYDNAGNLTSVADAASAPRNQLSLTYNANGTLASSTDGESHRTTFSYDSSGNLTQVTPPSVTSPGTLGSTQYTYDSLSRIATVTDGRGRVLTYSYDGLDRITRVAADDGSWISYTYDGNGNLLTRTDSAGSTTRDTYDKLNRMTEEDLPGAAYTDYTYDKDGDIASIVDQSGTVTYGYDDVNRVNSIVSPATGGGTDTVSYSYTDPTSSNAFTVRTATLPSGATEQVQRNLSSQITDVLLKDRSSTVLQERTYGFLNGTTQSNLVQTLVDQAGNRTTYTYANSTENVGRLLKARTVDRGGALVVEYDYGYDKSGNRIEKDVQTSSGTTTTTYAYNAANQLCWSYVGSSTNGCASPPSGATRFSYDAAGEQLTGSNTLTWDPYGRLASIDGTSLGYLSQTNDGLNGFGSTAQQSNMLGLSRTDDGTTVTSVVHAPGSDEPVSQTSGSTKSWYLTDNIGSTIALTDGSGAVARTYAYDPDGASTTSGSGPLAALAFASGQPIGSTGLDHFGARYYDPRIGRWTSIDPLRHDSDLTQANLYGYVGQDPMNVVDPTGLYSCAQIWRDYARNHHTPIPLDCNAGHPGPVSVSQAFRVVSFLGHVAACVWKLARTHGMDPSSCNQF